MSELQTPQIDTKNIEAQSGAEIIPLIHDETLRVLNLGSSESSADDVGLFEKLMAARVKFVHEMGWLPDRTDSDDSDRYDRDLSTMHIVKLSEAGDVEESMRLTKLDAFEDSLSMEMLANNKDVYDAVCARSDEFDGKDVWDLTRLIQPLDGSVDDFSILAGYLEMFGVGLRKTSSESQTWVYVTTEKIKNVLDFVGIQQEVIASGMLSDHDTEDSYFCKVDMNSAYKYLQDNREDRRIAFTVQHVEHGLAQADSL